MKYFIALLNSFLLFNSSLFAQFTVVYTANTNGNWTNASTWTRSCPVSSGNCNDFTNNANNQTPKSTYTYTGSGNPTITIQIVINSGVTVTLDTDYTFAETSKRITKMTINGTLSSAQKTSSPVSYYSMSLEGSFNGSSSTCNTSASNIQVGSSGSINKLANLSLSKSCGVFNGPVYLDGNLSSTNNTSLVINNYFQVKGNWTAINGNIDTDGNTTGFLDIGGCVTASPAGNLQSPALTVKFCINGNNGCTSSPSNPQTTNPTYFNCTGTQLPLSASDWRAESAAHGVWLKWRTIANGNLQELWIEKAQSNFQFTTLAKVDLLDFGSKNYQYFDNQAVKGNFYYRLKETYYDGTVRYSKIVAANEKNGVPQVKIFPNPLIHRLLHLEWLNPQEKVEIILMDYLGKVVYQANDLADAEGNLQIDLNKLEKGVFSIKIQQGYQSNIQKLVIE
jgi:hypothetical protein